MKTDQKSYRELFEEYLNNQVVLEIIGYSGGTNPIGGRDYGLNFDTGEVHAFDIKIQNKGNLGIVNMALMVSANHGRISGSFSGLANVAGSHWIAPWRKNWTTRRFNLKAKEAIWLKHEHSGGKLFGYAIDEPTPGSGGHYETEDLLTVRVAYWQPDINSVVLKPKDGPSDILTSFIQRN